MIVEFFMGHDKGIQEVYDHTSEFHPELFKRAYEKITAYLSLDASKIDESKIADQARTAVLDKLQKQDKRLAKLESMIAEYGTNYSRRR